MNPKFQERMEDIDQWLFLLESTRYYKDPPRYLLKSWLNLGENVGLFFEHERRIYAEKVDL